MIRVNRIATALGALVIASVVGTGTAAIALSGYQHTVGTNWELARPQCAARGRHPCLD